MITKQKTVIEGESLEQVDNVNYLGSHISYGKSNDVEIKISNFLLLLGMIKYTLLRYTRNERVLIFYKLGFTQVSQ